MILFLDGPQSSKSANLHIITHHPEHYVRCYATTKKNRITHPQLLPSGILYCFQVAYARKVVVFYLRSFQLLQRGGNCEVFMCLKIYGTVRIWLLRPRAFTKERVLFLSSLCIVYGMFGERGSIFWPKFLISSPTFS